MKKILITDDHYVVRKGIAFLLEANLQHDCTIEYAESFSETLEKVSQDSFDLLILDIHMPDSGFKTMVKQIKQIQDSLKILIFSADDEKIAFQYIEEGADGYINKNSEESQILKAVTYIFNDGFYYSKEIIDMMNSKTIKPIKKLSERELEVFKLLVEGNGNIEIANALDIQMSTISTHKKKIFEKLNVKTIVDLIRINDDLH